MSAKAVLATLKKLGKPTTVATYARHGLGKKTFGVSFADLGKLSKKLRRDHALALELWDSENVDARFLATLIADPEQLDAKTIDRWVGTVSAPSMVDMIARLVARAPCATKHMKRWMAAKKEAPRTFGHWLLAHLLKDGVAIPEDDLRAVLASVEKNIHASPNFARYAMNNAVIAIGTWRLPEEAIATARRIGKVEVDHGDTDCQTPDAEAYILKARARAKTKTKAKQKK